MVLARVTGTVVSTMKEPRLEGMKLLIVEKLDPKTMKGRNDFVIAIDAVGAGIGEVVLYVTGSSSRQTDATDGKPSDATITAIVDNVDIGGKLIYTKDRVGK